MIDLTLTGLVPSKKNAWRRGNGSKVYLPAQVQADIDALVFQAKALRHRLNIKEITGVRLSVVVVFHVPREHKDLDNCFTTLLDVLQKAGIIENDKLVREFHVRECITKEEPKTEIAISSLSTDER